MTPWPVRRSRSLSHDTCAIVKHQIRRSTSLENTPRSDIEMDSRNSSLADEFGINRRSNWWNWTGSQTRKDERSSDDTSRGLSKEEQEKVIYLI